MRITISSLIQKSLDTSSPSTHPKCIEATDDEKALASLAGPRSGTDVSGQHWQGGIGAFPKTLT